MRSIYTFVTLALVAGGCAAGFGGSRPTGLYETVPQTRPYRELGRIAVAPVGYGVSSQRARETALEALHARAVLLGADAVVAVQADHGCSWWPLLVALPNCYPRATGIAVVWE